MSRDSGATIASKPLHEFLLAVLGLAPSRNYVTQILRLLYESGGIDLDSFKQIYRGIVDPYVEELLSKLGIVVDKDRIRVKYMSLGWILASLYDDLFELFSSEEYRKKISEAAGIEVPDLLEEWIYLKLDIVFRDPAHGDNAKIAVKLLADRLSVTVHELTRYGLNTGEAYTVADILQSLGIAEHIDGVLRLSPQLVDKVDVLKKVLKRLGVL